jgi:maltooligosyltrehalose trehalohydrolase
MRVAGRIRRLPIGAEPDSEGGVHFRVWAPRCRRVSVTLAEAGGAQRSGGHDTPLEKEGNGYFSGRVEEAGPGTLYRYRLDEGDAYPDPATRFQPEGPHGPSQVIDPAAYVWQDDGWRGVPAERRVLYEMHIGTFTTDGTWTAAAAQLPKLAELGVTLLEIMPVADFAGRFGWGYDGVNLFAPTRLYGTPDDFRRFVDGAHGLGLGVILDVVYNHLGPDGNYLGHFSEHYFTDRYETDWGEPFNLDGPHSEPVREYVLSNVAYWIGEFHLDGFRLDATQSIFDAARAGRHIVAEIADTAHRTAADRTIFIVAENEPQEAINIRPRAAGGYGLDALWNDDWHHTAIVALTGRNEAYYSDYLGSPQELVSAAKYGFLYQGQHYRWQQKRRGTPVLDVPTASFVHYLQNHDQVANSARGERIHRLASPGELRALTALLLLGPATPMLFQGQEFAASAPFLYFADHHAELARDVSRGRRQFLQQFPSLALPQIQEAIPEPADPETFRRCSLDHGEAESHADAVNLHRDLLRMRREDATLRAGGPRGLDGAVLGGGALVLRYFGAHVDGTADRLLLVNLGRELTWSPSPEPLLAPPADCRWHVRWTSESVRYGGLDHPAPEDEAGRWHVPAQAAVLLAPESLVDGRSE